MNPEDSSFHWGEFTAEHEVGTFNAGANTSSHISFRSGSFGNRYSSEP